MRCSLLVLVASLTACGGGDGGSDASTPGDASGPDAGPADTGDTGLPPTDPVTLDPTEFTYSLEESTASTALWTTPVTRRVTTADRPPEATRSGLSLSAARGEFEAAQLVIGPGIPGSGTLGARVAVADFSDMAGARVDVSFAGYEAGVEETLTPLGPTDSIDLSAGQGTVVWLTVRVPRDATAGEHVTAVTVSVDGAPPITLPLRVYVFDFELPEQIHFATQLNIDVGAIAASRSVDEAKTLLFEHRFTPKSVTWPSGFRPGITWDSAANPERCASFYDEPDEGAEFSIGSLAPRYMLGGGWNGIGFPTAMTFQFVNNSTPRPDTFCGQSRGDHFGSGAYNTAWSAYLTGLNDYLVANGLDERAYYYVQNEPQDAEDDRVAAHLCRLTRAAAPNLRIAISEEPKPEIAEDADGACGYDIWIAHVRAYQAGYAWQRQRDHGEQVWFYSLDRDPPPYFNPTTIDAEGMHMRVIPWAAWSHRIRGYAYYDFGRYFHDGRPGVRAELFREGFEDYEYLWLANGGAHPGVGGAALPDRTVASVASSMTSWTQDPDALMALRHELGLYLEGTRATLPVLEVNSARPRAAYYVNFQDPAGAPTAEPLTVNGQDYLKVGYGAWDEELGYGWMGENVGTDIVMSSYDDTAGFDERQRSYVYDDYGRNNLFEFAIAPGSYDVTVGVGRPARGYPGDPHNLRVEGVVAVDDEVTTDASPTLERAVRIDVTDGRISFEVGGRSAATGDWAFTFLAYIEIVPAE